MLNDGLQDGHAMKGQYHRFVPELHIEFEEAVGFVDVDAMEMNVLDDGLRILHSEFLGVKNISFYKYQF